MTDIVLPKGMEVTQKDVGRIASMVRVATNRGHQMRDLKLNEAVAPGVFAVCVECNATLRWYQGKPQGEAYYAWCPEAALPKQEVVEEERNARLEEYGTYTLNDWATEINEWAYSKGWNEKLHPNGDHFDGLLMLMTSELSEALEEWRNGHAVGAIRFEPDKDGNPKPEGVPVELIDCVVRILHVLAYYGVNVNDVMQTKHEYNRTRPHRHGGKRA